MDELIELIVFWCIFNHGTSKHDKFVWRESITRVYVKLWIAASHINMMYASAAEAVNNTNEMLWLCRMVFKIIHVLLTTCLQASCWTECTSFHIGCVTGVLVFLRWTSVLYFWSGFINLYHLLLSDVIWDEGHACFVMAQASTLRFIRGSHLWNRW